MNPTITELRRLMLRWWDAEMAYQMSGKGREERDAEMAAIERLFKDAKDDAEEAHGYGASAMAEQLIDMMVAAGVEKPQDGHTAPEIAETMVRSLCPRAAALPTGVRDVVCIVDPEPTP